MVVIPSFMPRSTSAVISVIVAGDVPTLRSELASFSGWNACRVPSDLVMLIEMGVGVGVGMWMIIALLEEVVAKLIENATI